MVVVIGPPGVVDEAGWRGDSHCEFSMVLCEVHARPFLLSVRATVHIVALSILHEIDMIVAMIPYFYLNEQEGRMEYAILMRTNRTISVEREKHHESADHCVGGRASTSAENYA